MCKIYWEWYVPKEDPTEDYHFARVTRVEDLTQRHVNREN